MDKSHDRRRFERRPFRARVTISLPTHQVVLKANVLEISQEGVRLLCAEPVSEGADALLTFRMRIRRKERTEEVSGRVIHARMDDDAWVVGFKFNEALTRESTPLLAKAAASRDVPP